MALLFPLCKTQHLLSVGFWNVNNMVEISRLVLKIVVMARQKALMQEARVKRVWAILHFFTQFGFIVFTYLWTFAKLRKT
jgi:hypothetical protein